MGELLLVCERGGLNYDSIAREIYAYTHGEQVTLDFNVADRLLCGMHRWDDWYGEFSEYYYAVDLTWVQCACPGCTVVIKHDLKSKGPKPKWCSPSCQAAGLAIAKGTQKKRDKHYADSSWKRCRNGHTRSPENMIVISNGRGGTKLRCRECQRDANARAYQKRAHPVAA